MPCFDWMSPNEGGYGPKFFQNHWNKFVFQKCIYSICFLIWNPGFTILVSLKTPTRHIFMSVFQQSRYLTHPHFSEAALAQFDLQAKGLSGDFPGILSEPLSLRLHGGTHGRQPVAQTVCVFWTGMEWIHVQRFTSFEADWGLLLAELCMQVSLVLEVSF